MNVVVRRAISFVIFGFEIGGGNPNLWRVFFAGFGEVLYGLFNGKSGVVNLIDN